ncbi:MAG: prepilin peptidase [Lentisphaeria bacterium]|nr:prepilin peptidase [Lentisphaeria bacterium]
MEARPNSILTFFQDLFSDAPGIAIFDPYVFAEAIHEYPVFFAFVAFWFGCCIGSFLNVCVYRLPLGMSLVSPPSHCTVCDHKISVWENIPIFSYLFLRGKCRWCGAPISPRYLIGEMAVGLMYMASFVYVLHFKLPLPAMFLYFLTISVAYPAALIDMKVRLIPNELTYSLLLLAPLYHLIHGVGLEPHLLDWHGFLISIVTAGLFGTLLTLFAWLGEKALKREAFGLGDVKLIAGLAAALGALPVLWIMLAGSLIAVVFMPIYTLRHPKFRRRGFAFGPFLAVGLGLWLLFGIPVTDALLYPDRDLDISAISFVNDHHTNHYDRYRERVIRALRERSIREEEEEERSIRAVEELERRDDEMERRDDEMEQETQREPEEQGTIIDDGSD